MNPTPILRLLSLLAVALGVTAGWLAFHKTSMISAEGSSEIARRQALTGSPTNREPGAVATTPFASTPLNFDWATLDMSDYRQYIAGLRSIDCPEQTVRDIILAEVSRYFEPREAPFKTPLMAASESENERSRRQRYKVDFARRKSLRKVEEEKATMIQSLLGIQIPLAPLEGWHTRNYERHEAAINALPADKRERVREIQEAYWEKSDELNDDIADKYGGVRNAEAMERYRANNTHRLAELSQLLTADELELYEMRGSSVADRLGQKLAAWQPTEFEFRAIYRLRRTIDEPFGGTVRRDMVEGNVADPAGEAEFREKLAAELGPERLAEYDRVQDPGYQALSRLRKRFGLGQEAIDEAFQLWQKLGQSTSASPDSPGVANFDQKQMDARLRELLGDSGMTVLQSDSSLRNHQNTVVREAVQPGNIPPKPGVKPRPSPNP